MPLIRTTPVAAGEGAGFIDFVISLDAASAVEVKVSFQTDANSATHSGGQDYIFQSGTLTFAPGETSKTVRVVLSDGLVAEPTEVFLLDLFSPVNATVAQRFTPALIFDNDAPVATPALSVSDVVVDETARTASFFVWLNHASTGPVSASFATADDTAIAGADYAASSGLLSFAPGEVVKTVTVNLTDDTLAEPDEFFKLQLSGPSGATIADGVGVATIGRNDAAPVSTPLVLARPIAASEGDTFATFVVELSSPSTNEVRVSYQTDPSSATHSGGQDYLFLTDQLVFAPGETTKSVQVVLSDGTVDESTEVFLLDLFSPTNAVVAQRFTPALIFDNDGATGVPGLSVSDVTVDEDAQTASFFVWLDRASTSAVSVAYATADDTALAGSDYSAASGLLSFAPGEMVKTVTVNIGDDTLTEPDEFFKLQLTGPSGATIADGVGVAMIGRSDAAPVSTPQVLAKPIAVSEGDTFATFVVQLSSPSTNEVRVSYQTDASSATHSGAQDYIFLSDQLVFAPGETTKTVQVDLSDGTLAEPTEVFLLDLFSPVNAVVAQRFTPALIFDNDGATGTPGLSVSDVMVDEDAQTASFFVSLNRASTSAVSVVYATANDTAQAGSDFLATSGTLSFAPGEMVKTVTVNIVNDSLQESDESFRLQLSAPSGATLVDPSGAALIGRSDVTAVSTPQITATPLVVAEGDVFASFVVQLSAPARNEVRVTYQTDAGTATHSGASDYIFQSDQLVFAPGETTKLVQVVLTDDTVSESTEGFSLDLFSAVNATIPQRLTSATILDNDGAGSLYSYGRSNDLYTVSSALDRIAESPGGGIDTVRAAINYTLPDNVENLVLTGGAVNGIGNAGNNIFVGNAANNTFDGKEGVDTAVFAGAAAAHTVLGSVASRTVSGGGDGVDTLFSIERLQFADTLQASDTTPGGNTYLAYAMFNAGFDRAPSTAELSLWTSQLDRLGNLTDLAQAMINYYAPGVSDEVLVAYLWGTIVETPIPLDALATYVGLVVNGTYTQASLLSLVTTLDLNTSEIVGIVGVPLALDPAYFPVPGG